MSSPKKPARKPKPEPEPKGAKPATKGTADPSPDSTSHAHTGKKKRNPALRRHPKLADRRTIDPSAWIPTYLAHLAKTGRKDLSADRAKISFWTIQQRRKQDPEFATAEREAIDAACDRFEGELVRRAIDGVRQRIATKHGMMIKIEYSDMLLMRLLEKNRPEWRQKQQVEHTGELMHMTLADARADLEKARAAQKQLDACDSVPRVPTAVDLGIPSQNPGSQQSNPAN